MEKQRSEESEKRKAEERRSRCAKRLKNRKHCFFPRLCGPGGSKSRFAKATGAEPSVEMGDEKLHAIAARNASQSQNAKNTSVSDHFGALRCSKSACPCGAKHISKSKREKHTMFGTLLEVTMWKKCMALWREAHLQVKICKTHHVRNTFGN